MVGGEAFRRRQKALARSTMASRSFSSPQGELEMHRLRRALERVSFDQTLGGRLDESDGETKPPSQETASRRSLMDSSELARMRKSKISVYQFNLQLVYLTLQTDSCFLPPPWTGTASQTQSISLPLSHPKTPLQGSVAPTFTAC